MIDSTNQTKIDFIYQYISYDKDADIIRAEKEDAQTDLLDRNMQVKVTGVINQINKDKNFIRVRQGESYTYYNFKLEEKKNTELLTGNTLFLSKKDGKYGYVNEKGVVIVNYIYDDATEQNKYGYVAVKKDGKWGALDAKANTIVEPTYTLENNLVIDFIGKWHLAEDLNANYYTDRDGLN
ncbi:MAG: WG repeat-containing protein [Clostridia bacterium]